MGIVTRSTIAALLLTILFWLLLFGVNTADGILVMPRALYDVYVEKLHAKIEAAGARGESGSTTSASLERQLTEAQATQESWRRWHGMVLTAKTALPKTDDTIKLLERWLVKSATLPETPNDESEQRQMMPFLTGEMYVAGVRAPEVFERMEANYRSRSVLWVLGTSLMFEAVVLAIALWIFVRRDF